MKITKIENQGNIVAYKLENDNGMSVQIGTMGAALQRVDLPDGQGGTVNVCLNFEDMADYAGNTLYAGASVAPVAGRIAGSRFAIGNKIWLGMEMYMAALMSFGAEENAARDEAMAVKLMPVLTAALDGRIPREERGLSETLDAIFGEDHTALCRKAVKESGAELA